MICKVLTKILKDKIQIKKMQVLIVFNDMIADIINNKKLHPLVTGLFIRGRKLNISIICITQLYFKAPKEVRHNTHTLSYYDNSK